jgi:protein TonB
MFDIFLPAKGAGRSKARKAMTFCLSLLIHAAVIAAVIVVPLLRAEAGLPRFKIIDTALIAPPVLPGVPPSGRPRSTAVKPGLPKGGDHGRSSAGAGGFKVPTEITKITDEEISLLLSGEDGRVGVIGGADGEDLGPEWEIGRDFVPESVKPGNGAIITVRSPRLIKRVNPVYPPTAIAARVSGPVVIAAITDIYGRVREARVINGHALLSASAMEAVREWIYEPYLVNGVPMPVSFTVTVTFTLGTR